MWRISALLNTWRNTFYLLEKGLQSERIISAKERPFRSHQIRRNQLDASENTSHPAMYISSL